MVQKVTEEKLKNVIACEAGRKWFSKYYPKGMLITKNNLKGLIFELSRLRKSFPTYHGSPNFFTSKIFKHDHTLTCLSFVLEAVYGSKAIQDYCAIDNNLTTLKTTPSDLLDWVWEDVKSIRQAI